MKDLRYLLVPVDKIKWDIDIHRIRERNPYLNYSISGDVFKIFGVNPKIAKVKHSLIEKYWSEIIYVICNTDSQEIEFYTQKFERKHFRWMPWFKSYKEICNELSVPISGRYEAEKEKRPQPRCILKRKELEELCTTVVKLFVDEKMSLIKFINRYKTDLKNIFEVYPFLRGVEIYLQSYENYLKGCNAKNKEFNAPYKKSSFGERMLKIFKFWKWKDNTKPDYSVSIVDIQRLIRSLQAYELAAHAGALDDK